MHPRPKIANQAQVCAHVAPTRRVTHRSSATRGCVPTTNRRLVRPVPKGKARRARHLSSCAATMRLSLMETVRPVGYTATPQASNLANTVVATQCSPTASVASTVARKGRRSAVGERSPSAVRLATRRRKGSSRIPGRSHAQGAAARRTRAVWEAPPGTPPTHSVSKAQSSVYYSQYRTSPSRTQRIPRGQGEVSEQIIEQ